MNDLVLLQIVCYLVKSELLQESDDENKWEGKLSFKLLKICQKLVTELQQSTWIPSLMTC